MYSTQPLRKPKSRLISDVMRTHVVFVRDDDSLEAMGELVDTGDIVGAPIVDDTGDIVGVVSADDVPSELEPRRLLQARDVMEPIEERLRKSWPIERARAALRAQPLAAAVPVFDDDTDEVVGLVGRDAVEA